jgi:hypothetical protein
VSARSCCAAPTPTTGETLVVEVPCGATRAAVCPSCADRARRVRAQQCREGWHLEHEPHLAPRPGDDEQRSLVEQRAAATAELDAAQELAAVADPDPEAVALARDLTDEVALLDDELAATGARGSSVPPTTRRKRSTRRRDDVPDLPRRPSTGSTLGRTYTDLASFAPDAQEVLNAMLSKFVEYGATELSPRALQAPPISDLGTVAELATRFDGAACLHSALDERGKRLFDVA